MPMSDLRCRAVLAIAASGVLTVMVSGCADMQPPGPPPEVDAEALPTPEIATQRTITQVAEAKAALHAILAGKRPVVPADLQAPLAWRWRGPLDRGAMMVAQVVNYQFIGPPPGPPLPEVHVNTSGMPALDILRAFGRQVGADATVDVDPVARTVKVFRP
jgi:hypothetical protein